MSAFDMKGTIDIHVHAGPSVAKRKVDSGEMLLNAQAAGYRAFVTKDHYFPSMMGDGYGDQAYGRRHHAGDGVHLSE